MPSVQFMQQAMAENGRLAHHAIGGDLVAFAALGLSGAERLSAVAGVVAAATAKRHAPGSARFLQQLQELTRPGAGCLCDGEALADQRAQPIAAGIGILDAGFDRLAEQLAAARVPPDRAAAVEAVLLARLLAAHRPHRIRLALLACAIALAQAAYRPGDLVPFLPAEVPSSMAPAAAIAEAARTGTFG